MQPPRRHEAARERATGFEVQIKLPAPLHQVELCPLHPTATPAPLEQFPRHHPAVPLSCSAALPLPRADDHALEQAGSLLEQRRADALREAAVDLARSWG